jgi:cytochrome oxidase Cu insertion factor (SCO1/SenC/PrrC family)
MQKFMILAALLLAALGSTSFAVSAKPAADEKAEKAPPLALKVGDTAPDFTLKDQNRKEFSLRQFHGKKSVVLAFYVFAFTGG